MLNRLADVVHYLEVNEIIRKAFSSRRLISEFSRIYDDTASTKKTKTLPPGDL